MSTFMPGTHVRFKMGNLGLIGRSEVVNEGDEGVVIGPGPDEGWIYVEPCKFSQAVCPVSPGMIEEVR